MAANANGAAPSRAAEPRHGRLWHLENGFSGLLLVLVAVVPTAEILARWILKTGILGASDLTHHLVLWLTCLGGAMTSREGKHITLSAGVDLIREPARGWILTITSFISASIAAAMTWSSLALVLIGFDPAKKIGIVPIQIAAAVLPVGFALIAARFVIHAPSVQAAGSRVPGRAAQRAVAGLGLAAGTAIAFSSVMDILASFLPRLPEALYRLADALAALGGRASPAAIVVLIVSVLFGTPVFIGLGGVAYLLFVGSGGSLAVIPNEAYGMLTSYSIPAIPLFTFAGFILSESQAGKRLVRLFKAFVGWLPGGLVIMAVLVCTFFTTFTGATGVTILALGGLLIYTLEQGGYKSRFSEGLLTSSGSIGLLFPPSLPIILYGVTAQINIKHMFAAGIIPGVLMVLCLCAFGVVTAITGKVERVPFQLREAWASVRESFWEILLPLVILVLYFVGLTTLVETGAVAVIYSLIVEVAIHRDLKLRDLGRVILKCVPIIGGVLIILAGAKGLSYYIVDAEVPVTLSAWVKAYIGSKYLFLLALNVVLLIVGCLMDIFSAILVVVPLIIPMGAAFGIDPVHLGIIFLANLGLGYLTPPVGLNLFLASYLFNKPLTRIYRDVVPFFLALLAVVLLVTYVPWLSTGLIALLKL
jgi:tripartite ATP-independent transporter DctM subunit